MRVARACWVAVNHERRLGCSPARVVVVRARNFINADPSKSPGYRVKAKKSRASGLVRFQERHTTDRDADLADRLIAAVATSFTQTGALEVGRR